MLTSNGVLLQVTELVDTLRNTYSIDKHWAVDVVKTKCRNLAKNEPAPKLHAAGERPASKRALHAGRGDKGRDALGSGLGGIATQQQHRAYNTAQHNTQHPHHNTAMYST